MGWPWLDALIERPTKRIVGLISGTSADGIAAALAEITTGTDADRPEVALRGFRLSPFPEEVRARVLHTVIEPLTTQALSSLSY